MRVFESSILLLSCACLSSGANLNSVEYYEKLFAEWLTKHKMTFADAAEFGRRLRIFSDNHDKITAHNEKHPSFQLGHNEYSHMTLTEFHDHFRIGATRPKNLRKRTVGLPHPEPEDALSLPASVDWVEKGAVTEVKNQGACGSCWSFSAVGALEGAYYVKYGNLISFSEQELVSCDDSDYGCNGGFMDDAFAWIEKNGGLCTEDDYAYTSGTGSTGVCQKTCKNIAEATPKSYTDVKIENVKALMSAVSKQPIAIAIEADQFAFQFYKSGVLDANCGTNLDHGVLLVGYGTTEEGVDYWKVKNSWGASWGLDGYILIARSAEDLCGVLAAPSYPVL